MDSVLIKVLDTFFQKYTRLKYKKGDVILRAEDTPQGVFYLKKGYVRQYMVAESGAMLMLHIFKPNSFFPMTWVLNDTPNTYYLEAVTSVDVWRAPKDAVKEFLRDHPDVVMNLTQRLLLGMSGLRHRIEFLVMSNAYQKTLLLLLYLAENLGEIENGEVVLPVPVTHREISAWIGTTRETASLQVETLKKHGLIMYRKRQMIIPSIKNLEKELNK
jgi:CRP/FNR family transcriptional regulator